MIEARIDLDAIAANVGVLAERAGPAAVMAVVKADGYGHGLLPSARAALAGGASWLGAATIDEALEVRRAGIDAPILAWLLPGAPSGSVEDPAGSTDGPVEQAISEGIDLSVADTGFLDRLVEIATRRNHVVRVHLKVDTGLGRNGSPLRDWPDLVDAAAKAQADGTVDVIGVWSHLAYADAPRHPTIAAQHAAFEDALQVVRAAGIDPQLRHLANSAATLALPGLHYDLVRPGIAVYGLSPGREVGSARELGLLPAMTAVARVALVKRVPEGHGVSYGHRYHTSAETTLALIPAGYADGVPRNASNTAEVWAAGRRRRIAGTVCMDQFVLDVGDDPIASGDEVILWGPGDRGEPTADDWADALGTINYEIVTRIGPRMQRVYRGTGQ